MESIIQSEKECLVCGYTQGIHKHHIFYGTSNRKNSERYGLTVWLCGRHHNMSDEGVHFNKELNTTLKQLAQQKFEEQIGTRTDFIRIFGKSYL